LVTDSAAGSFCFLWGWRLLLVGRYPPACCSSRLSVFLLRLLQKVNGAQCQQLSLAVLLASWSLVSAVTSWCGSSGDRRVFVHRMPCVASVVGGPVSTGLLQQPLASCQSFYFLLRGSLMELVLRISPPHGARVARSGGGGQARRPVPFGPPSPLAAAAAAAALPRLTLGW
jgi:hypothetical protein